MFFIQSSIDRHELVSISYILPIVNDAAVNMGHGSTDTPDDSVFISCGYIRRSGIAESCSFNFLRNIYYVLHSCSIHLHSYQLCTRVPFFHILPNICYPLPF